MWNRLDVCSAHDTAMKKGLAHWLHRPVSKGRPDLASGSIGVKMGSKALADGAGGTGCMRARRVQTGQAFHLLCSHVPSPGSLLL